MDIQYNAFVVDEVDGKFVSSVKKLNTVNLPMNEVLVKVHYSSLNFKDALSASGNKGVTKSYPHTPGIDAAGEVVESKHTAFEPGDKVLVTGYDLGMNTPGGFGEYIRIPANWIVKLPDGLTLKESMIIGTAGFTAAISFSHIAKKLKPEQGKIVVTGATGGVGSVALCLLNQAGFSTVAVSGKQSESDFLTSLGANEMISREQFQHIDTRPVLSSRYAGAIDTVGGVALENIIKTLHPQGVVTTCGSVGGTKLHVSVFPFILRGVSLIGVSAQNFPAEQREPLWKKLAGEWKPQKILHMYNEISRNELSDAIQKILRGEMKGRTVVSHL